MGGGAQNIVAMASLSDSDSDDFEVKRGKFEQFLFAIPNESELMTSIFGIHLRFY